MTDHVDLIELDLLTLELPEVFVYHVINGELPWLNKVGIGSEQRVEVWERRGWVVQTRLLLHNRDDALAIERLLMEMNHITCRSPRLVALKSVLRTFGTIDGHTEMWDAPFLLGQPDDMTTPEQHITGIAAVLRSCVREFYVG